MICIGKTKCTSEKSLLRVDKENQGHSSITQNHCFFLVENKFGKKLWATGFEIQGYGLAQKL